MNTKARPGALGALQKEDIKYFDTFSLTSIALSICMIMARALKRDSQLTHVDIKRRVSNRLSITEHA